MITGTSNLSLRKQQLVDETLQSTGYQNLTFSHLCTANQTTITLTALTTPTQLSSAGFIQPTPQQLVNAQLLFNRNNLTLTSSLRGTLVDYLAYTVSSSSTITLLTPAQENEIIVGKIAAATQSGVQMVGASSIPATGTLAPGQNTFYVGNPFQVGANISSQIGSILVYVDGVLQYRNTGNSSTVLDGNYYEVNNGNGYGTSIVFNTVDNQNTLNICVLPNGLLVEQPTASQMALLENMQGQINNLANYVADAGGNSVSTVLGAAPSNQDLLAFGTTVSSLNTNAALKNVGNTWTAAQSMLGQTSGATIAAGYVGQTLSFTCASTGSFTAASCRTASPPPTTRNTPSFSEERP